MPMLHILSTHGFLLSFNLLNLQQNRIDICSPPQNIADQSGLNAFKQSAVDNRPLAQITTPPQTNITKTPSDLHGNLTFSIPSGATSTPAKPPLSQAKPTFGLTETPQSKPAMTNLFGATSTPAFSGFNLGGSKEPPKSFAAPSITATPIQAPVAPPKAVVNSTNTITNAPKQSTEASKPFLTVQSNYKPATQATKCVYILIFY